MPASPLLSDWRQLESCAAADMASSDRPPPSEVAPTLHQVSPSRHRATPLDTGPFTPAPILQGLVYNGLASPMINLSPQPSCWTDPKAERTFTSSRTSLLRSWTSRVLLPTEESEWTRLEVDLYTLSGGAYHPTEMARKRRIATSPDASGTGSQREVPGRVSVVSPTLSSRQHYHEQLWACFEAQTWPDKELVVVETHEVSPSVFLEKKAKEDSRLVLISFQRPPGGDFSVGLKRDMTLHLASGSVVANFDDDDIYAACYLADMVAEMDARGLVALTLSSWYNYIVPRSVCAYTDPDEYENWDPQELEEVLYGYGFSYIHRRSYALVFPYPDLEFAEDAPFLLRLKRCLGPDKVGLMRDTKGICMHIVHGGNSTGTDGESLSHDVSQAAILGLAVADLPIFQDFLSLRLGSWWQLSKFTPRSWLRLLPPRAYSSSSPSSAGAETEAETTTAGAVPEPTDAASSGIASPVSRPSRMTRLACM